jgi:muramoyltetrapeptide carboxypeptidase
MLKPPALGPSSLVGVVAPASPVRPQYLEAGLAELERLGFRTRVARSIYARSRYTAGDADVRAEELQAMWDDPEVEAVFAARGGYGAMELLDRLDPGVFRAKPKLFLGSSDVTALLCFLASQAGLVSLHGPMVAQHIARGEGAYDGSSFEAMLRRREPPGRIPAPGASLIQPGSAEGVLLGGCLSLVTALVGTPFLPRFDGAILFLEDRGVKPYQIDRLLTQMRLAGCLTGVRGVVFGEMLDCQQNPQQGYRLEELLADLTAGLGVPVLFGFPSGHTVSPAVTIPFGVRARLDDEGLHILEGAVA